MSPPLSISPQVKEILTGSSRDAWTEFVKCLDLFSHEALSKREVLLLAQELLGAGHEDLLEEFKSLDPLSHSSLIPLFFLLRALISSKSAYDSSKQVSMNTS
jgi:histone deacetylase complex regulatory component SIN3